MKNRENGIYNRIVKRIIDLVLSALIMLILSPLLLLLVLAIKLDSKGPVLFRQKRVGAGKSTFSILKFRTMRIDTPLTTCRPTCSKTRISILLVSVLSCARHPWMNCLSFGTSLPDK